jgi:hypothetical protein
MESNPFVVVLTAVAILNGIFSTFFWFTAQAMILVVAPGLLITGTTLVSFFASLIAATATILLSGAVAAVFERVTGRTKTDAVSYSVWVITAVILSFPAFGRAISLLLG